MSGVVVVNVSGRRFEIDQKLLSKYSESTLARLNDGDQKEITVQRPTAVFKSVLAYYQTGHLHLPSSVCLGSVKEELHFWGLSVSDLDPCCRRSLNIFYRNQSAIQMFEAEEASAAKELRSSPSSFVNKVRHALWKMLDRPFSSWPAKVYFIISCAVVITSTTLLVLGSLPQYRQNMRMVDWKDYFGDDYYYDYKEEIHAAYISQYDYDVTTHVNDHPPGNFTLPPAHRKKRNIILAGHICALFFILELLVKLLCCPGIIRFLRSIYNFIDVVAVVASCIEFIIEIRDPTEKFRDSYVDGINGLLVLRVLRLFRLARYIKGGRVLVYALKMSLKEVGFMALLLAINTIVFGTVAYYIDMEKMMTILDACWWAVITMTTVGYGDIVPISPASKVIGAICACMGILIMALTLPLFVNNFTMLYSHTTATEHPKMDYPEKLDMFNQNCLKEREGKIDLL